MIRNRCPKCGSKNVVEILSGTDKRDTKSKYYMPGYITDQINRSFYCNNCRHVYDTENLKKEAEYNMKKAGERVVLCLIYR